MGLRGGGLGWGGVGGELFQPQTGTPADLALPPENLKQLIFFCNLCVIFFY